MARRQPLPRLWLMTDERIGDALWPALERLPRGGGVVFRHYATPARERRRLFEMVRAIARRRRLVLVLAGSARQAIGWRADGVHGRSPHVRHPRSLLKTAPAHGPREIRAAMQARADLVFLSPVFPTRSHPGQRTLGPLRFGLAVPRRRPGPSSCRFPRGNGTIIALGGMTPHRFRRLRALGAYGWAAIDALS
jgi:thiamine-phosphate pyrophosphorylase